MATMETFYKAVLDREFGPVVLCDLKHTILYMNNAAKSRYANQGGESLIGKSLMSCHSLYATQMISKVIAWFLESNNNNVVYTYRNDSEDKDVYMVALRDDGGELIGYYEKHAYRAHETMSLYEMD